MAKKARLSEKGWLTAVDPKPMLKYLRDRVSERKLRLFAIACCRRIDRLITDPRSRAALGFAEQHVDAGYSRRKGKAALRKAARDAQWKAHRRLFGDRDWAPPAEWRDAMICSNAADAASDTLHEGPWLGACYAASFASSAVGWELMKVSSVRPGLDLDRTLPRPERAQQALLLRDIIGNPFRRPPAIDLTWLRWRDGTVQKLAQAIYEERAFERLPILADALEDAGCTEARILDHLRGPGPHTRGCWLLDLLLKKG
jgi:hypothetical protein